MLLRVGSQPLEIDGAVYQFISKENSDIYEPEGSEHGTISPEKAGSTGIPWPATGLGELSIYVDDSGLVQTATVREPPDAERRTSDTEHSPSAVQPKSSAPFGLPKDWVIFPLPKDKHNRTSSIKIEVTKDNDPSPQILRQDTFEEYIDIDWDDAENPVKFSPRAHEVTPVNPTIPSQHEKFAITNNLKPICFSIIDDDDDDPAPTFPPPRYSSPHSQSHDPIPLPSIIPPGIDRRSSDAEEDDDDTPAPAQILHRRPTLLLSLIHI